MNEIEKKALALLNGPHLPYEYLPEDHLVRVLCRAIEAHEAFRQEVSDAVEDVIEELRPTKVALLSRFVITKPDPLVEALSEIDHAAMAPNECANDLRAALAARGLEIREIEK
jgi:hypothetical protein